MYVCMYVYVHVHVHVHVHVRVHVHVHVHVLIMHAHIHTDLYQKTQSDDGIMGSEPYGYSTSMFSIVGPRRSWKLYVCMYVCMYV